MASDAQERAVAIDLMLLGASVKKNSISPAKVKRSADPRNRYCSANQRNVIPRGSEEFISPDSAATLFRFISTRAAAAMATIERNSPVPILCRWVIPISVLVTLLANGMMIWLYVGARIMMKMTGKIGREAGGTFKDPSLVFMVAACWTEKVDSWARQQLSIMVQAKMGRIVTTIFTSSTSFTVHSNAEQNGASFTALFRNLRLSVGACLGAISLERLSSFLLISVVHKGLAAMLTTALVGFLILQVWRIDATTTFWTQGRENLCLARLQLQSFVKGELFKSIS